MQRAELATAAGSPKQPPSCPVITLACSQTPQLPKVEAAGCELLLHRQACTEGAGAQPRPFVSREEPSWGTPALHKPEERCNWRQPSRPPTHPQNIQYFSSFLPWWLVELLGNVWKLLPWLSKYQAWCLFGAFRPFSPSLPSVSFSPSCRERHKLLLSTSLRYQTGFQSRYLANASYLRCFT